MRYSIIIPVYNGAAFLNESINSVLNQKLSDWELILVDDGSTDSSGEIAETWAARDMRVRVIHQDNQGQFYARQSGIEHSRGDYLLFLDCDDRWKPDFFSILDSAVNKYEPDLLLYTGCVIEDSQETGKMIGKIAEQTTSVAASKLKETLISSDHLNSLCLKCFRRSLFDADPEDYHAFHGVSFGEDKARLLVPVTRAERIWYIPDVLYEYHRHKDSVTRNMSAFKGERMLANDLFEMLRRYLPIWKMEKEEYRDMLDAYYIRNFLNTYYSMRKHLKDGMKIKAYREFFRNGSVYRGAFRRKAIRLLSPRDRIRLLGTMLRL